MNDMVKLDDILDHLPSNRKDYIKFLIKYPGGIYDFLMNNISYNTGIMEDKDLWVTLNKSVLKRFLSLSLDGHICFNKGHDYIYLHEIKTGQHVFKISLEEHEFIEVYRTFFNMSQLNLDKSS